MCYVFEYTAKNQRKSLDLHFRWTYKEWVNHKTDSWRTTHSLFNYLVDHHIWKPGHCQLKNKQNVEYPGRKKSTAFKFNLQVCSKKIWQLVSKYRHFYHLGVSFFVMRNSFNFIEIKNKNIRVQFRKSSITLYSSFF